MTIKISDLPSIEASSLISAATSAIPLIANTGNVITYQTSVANVKTYVETGNLNVTGAVYANSTSFFTNVTITGNLNVQGTTTSTSSQNLSTNSSIIDLHTFSSNLDPWTSDDGRDIGLRFFWYKGSAGTSALVWENDTSYLTWYGSGVGNSNAGTVTGTLGTIQAGQVLIANATATTANATGALQVSGGTSIGGNLWVGGNIDGKGYVSTTGAATFASLVTNGTASVGSTLTTGGATTAQSLAVNTVASVGSTLVVGSTATVNALNSNGNITATNIRSSASLTVAGTATVNALVSNGSINGTTLVGSGTATVNALVVNTTIGVSGTTTTRDITPVANISYDIGTSSNRYLNVYAASFIGQSTSALYADLAEKYTADADYAPGTVVVFGGNKEITVTDLTQDVRVAGVVSTAPAYLMNSESDGLPVALRGKVPTNVVGPVQKGSLLVTSTTAGYAQAVTAETLTAACAVVAKSLVDDANTSPRTIMAVIV